ncbi:MAG: TolC family protein [Candidatus Omnitrophota bacterium]
MKNLKTSLIIISILCFVGASDAVAGEGNPQKRIALSIAQVSKLALENNIDIQIAKYDAYINRTAVSEVNSIFDTVLKASAVHSDDQRKSGSTFSGTKNTANDYSLGIEKKIISGTTLGVDFEDSRSWTNSAFTSVNPAHDASVRFSISQPLGRNFLGLVDRGNVKVTKLEVANSDSYALDRIEQSLASVQSAYWQLMLKYAELEIEKDMLKKAQELYAIFKEQSKLGLVEDAELFASGANVEERRASVTAAQNNVLLANNALLLLLQEEDSEIVILPEEVFSVPPEPLALDQSLRIAIAQRRDYQQANNDIEVKKINLDMKKNNLWPQIDLEASFLHNGLEVSQEDAWGNTTEEDNPQLYAGITVRVPLENSSARGAQKKAQIEKAKALLQLKKVEHKIVIEVNDATNTLNNAAEQIGFKERIVVLQSKKLVFEEKRFSSGRSNSDTLIRYQEDLLRAKIGLAGARCAYKLALIDLKLAQNSLLDEYWQGKL